MVGRDLVQAERVDPLDRDREIKAARGETFDRFGVGDERLAQKVVHRLVGEPVGVGTVQDLYAVGRLAVAERQTDIADHRFLRRIALRIVEGDLRAVRPFPLEKDGVDPVLNASLIGFGDLFPVGAVEREELELAAVEGGVLVFVHHHRKTHRRRAEREVKGRFKTGPRRALAVGDVGEIFDLGTDIGDRCGQFAVLPLDLAALLDEGAEIVVGIGAAAGTGERRKTGHAGNDLVQIAVARIPDKPGHGSLLKSDPRFRRLPVDQLAALGHKTRKSRFGKVDERTTAGDISVVQFGHEFLPRKRPAVLAPEGGDAVVAETAEGDGNMVVGTEIVVEPDRRRLDRQIRLDRRQDIVAEDPVAPAEGVVRDDPVPADEVPHRRAGIDQPRAVTFGDVFPVSHRVADLQRNADPRPPELLGLREDLFCVRPMGFGFRIAVERREPDLVAGSGIVADHREEPVDIGVVGLMGLAEALCQHFVSFRPFRII